MTTAIQTGSLPGQSGGVVKSPTGIRGFDEIASGGLPTGRPTLVTGASGSGKTLFGLEFLVRGARDFGEPGVLLAPHRGHVALSTRRPRAAKSTSMVSSTTRLTHDAESAESSAVGVSSLTDSWLPLRNVESDGERNRQLFVIKSRGTAHSNQVREFVLTDAGADLLDVYVGPQGVLTGSARDAQVARDQAESAAREAVADRRRLDLDRRKVQVEAQIAALRAQLESEAAELTEELSDESRVHAGASAAQSAAGLSRTVRNVTGSMGGV